MIFAPEIWVFVFFLFFFKMLTDCWWLVSSHKSCPRQTSLIFYVEGGQNYWTWKVWAGKVFPELWHQIHGSEELVTVWISFQKFHAWVFICHNLWAIPEGQWMSESLIVSDLEIAIASPSFASLLKYVWWENWHSMHLPISHQKTRIFASLAGKRRNLWLISWAGVQKIKASQYFHICWSKTLHSFRR